MKKLIVFLLVVGALFYAWKSGLWNQLPGMTEEPRVMTDPVYAEIRFTAEVQDRSFTMVTYAKAYDQADCRRISEHMVNTMQTRQDATGVALWRLVSSECKSSLDSRNAKLFDNKPTFVNYVSASPGDPSEREVRLIIWGVTAEEGKFVCDEVNRVQQKWKGTVTCIRALASQ